MTTNDARCTNEIKPRSANEKSSTQLEEHFSPANWPRIHETSEVLHLEQSTALTLWKVDKKYLESFETWCWRRMEKISWPDRVRNAELLPRVKEERNILYTKEKLIGLVIS